MSRRRRSTTELNLGAPPESPETPLLARSFGHSPGANRVRNDVRQSIAHHAARLIAEGLTDYHAAKLKAAKQLHVSDKKSLPDNHEIEAALREYHALFAGNLVGNVQAEALAELRRRAELVMRGLAAFEPWISGAVLNGTANEMSVIELELIGADEKSFEMILLNKNIDFSIREQRHRKNVVPTVTYEFDFDNVPIEVTLFETQAARATVYPVGSIRHERMQLASFALLPPSLPN
jgi:hypothetical protein